MAQYVLNKTWEGDVKRTSAQMPQCPVTLASEYTETTPSSHEFS